MKKQSKKEELIELVIEDLFQNVWENESYIKDLIREALKFRTNVELKQIVYG
jgi:hypothetical protein